MTEYLKKRLTEFNIDLFCPISIKHCHITRDHKLKRIFNDISNLSVIVIAVPYLVKTDNKNLSAYAVSKDYHIFFKELFDILIPELECMFEGYRFCGFADDSPIDERHAAAICGLGVIGENQMLITEKYSSYVFLGEIITDCPIECVSPKEIKKCGGCGRCKKACPMIKTGICLSALTQKKGELNEGEADAIIKHGSVWGCDICQEVCPHTKKAVDNGTIYTNIDFFKEDIIPILTKEDLDSMSDDEFKNRAYSWRGRQTIGRNLALFDSKKQ